MATRVIPSVRGRYLPPVLSYLGREVAAAILDRP